MSRSSQEPPLRPSNRMRSRSERARCDACKEREVQNAQLHSEMRALEMELKELRKRPDRGYCGRCREWEAQYAQLQSENHSLGTQLQELQKRIQELNEIIRGHEADAKLLTAQKQQLKVENERLKTQTAELLRELEQAKSVSGTDSRGSPWVGSELPSGVRSITPYAQDLARERDELAATNKRLVENLADLQRQLQERSGSERRPRPPSLSDTPNSFSDSSSQPPALAEPQEASDQGSNAPLKQKIRHLEVQLEKSTNVIAVKDDELAQLRELLGALSNVGMIPEGRHAGRDSSSTEGSGARSFDPRGVKPSFGGKPSTKTELVPQLQRVLGSLGSENVRLLQENSQLSTMVHELNSQVASLQAFRDEANQTHQRLQAQVGDTTLMKSLQTELSAAHMFISELEAELGAAREEASKLQSDSTQRENFVGSLQARLAQAEQELRDTVQKLDQTSRAAAEEAQKRDIFFAELKSQLVSHISSFAGELKEVLGQLGGLLPVLSESLEKHALSGARASIDQALHVAQGFLRVIQGFSMEKLSGAQEDAVVQGVLQQVAFAEQRCTQQAAENRCLVDELKAAERKAAEKTEQIFRLQSDKMLMDSLLLQSNQDLLQLRASLGRLEIANAQLEAALAMLFGQNGFFKLKYQQLLRAKHEAMQDETYHLQQEVSRMSGALRQAHLQAQEHDLMFEKLKQERDIIAEEEAKLRAELGAVRGTAVSDNARLKAELSSCAMQLEQVSKAQREKSEEIMRLQQVISNLTVSSREAQYEAQNREAELEALKHEREQWLEENAKLRADCGKIRAELSSVRGTALTEQSCLKDELKDCTTQLEQMTKRQKDDQQEMIRLRQEVSVLTFSARDRDVVLEEITRDRDQKLESLATLQTELTTVRKAALSESCRLKEELEAHQIQLKGKEAAMCHAQQEITALKASVKEVHLQMQEREQAYERLKLDFGQRLEDCEKLRAELATVLQAANMESFRLKSELKSSASQLEQALSDLKGKSGEVSQLRDEASLLTNEIRETQARLKERESELDKLKQESDNNRQECDRLRADCGRFQSEVNAVSGAALAENGLLKDELKSCANQLEQAMKGQREKGKEVARLQQELSLAIVSAQEREAAFERLMRDRDVCFEASASLRGELTTVRGTALSENLRLRDELADCEIQLERAKAAQREKEEEAARLQREISSVSALLCEAQRQTKDYSLTVENLRCDHVRSLAECEKLRSSCSEFEAKLAAVSGVALEERAVLQAELKQVTSAQDSEVARLQQKISAMTISAQERDLAFERLAQDRNQCFDELNKLRGEVVTIHGTAVAENLQLKDDLSAASADNSRIKSELNSCKLELERLTREHTELRSIVQQSQLSTGDEAQRKSQEIQILSLQSEIKCLSDRLRQKEDLAARSTPAHLALVSPGGLAGTLTPSSFISVAEEEHQREKVNCASILKQRDQEIEYLRGQLDLSQTELYVARTQREFLKEENARLQANEQRRSFAEGGDISRSSGCVLEVIRSPKPGGAG
eukprot:RCo021967